LQAQHGNPCIVIASAARQSKPKASQKPTQPKASQKPTQPKANQKPSQAMPTEAHLKILKCIEANPHISQRQLAQELGVSVGKINYCMQALMTKGLLKAGNFKRSSDKMAYLYLLTPAGIEEKTKLTASFLKRKIAEHEKITQEIEQLKRDM
jgi:EPS-associated MarR family transcriptional regulator